MPILLLKTSTHQKTSFKKIKDEPEQENIYNTNNPQRISNTKNVECLESVKKRKK